jgi:uncharacterized membrane protein YdbT with pleckstrin-like domain
MKNHDASALIPGEVLIHKMRPHWITLVKGTFLGIALTIATFFIVKLLHDHFPNMNAKVYFFFIAVYFIMLFAWAGMPWVRWFTTTYLFTSQRIITREGLLRITGEAVPLSKVNSIQFSKTLLERILGSGSLEIETAAEEKIIIKNVMGVEEIQKQIAQTMDRAKEKDE